MPTLSIDQVQAQLPQLIDQLQPGEEVVITRGDKTVARLVSFEAPQPTPVFGACKGMLEIRAEDEEHLKDFAEYVP
jgi:antitoxin (DNA-binding transcriptional repressor) of toxin-antitoxin stability system